MAYPHNGLPPFQGSYCIRGLNLELIALYYLPVLLGGRLEPRVHSTLNRFAERAERLDFVQAAL